MEERLPRNLAIILYANVARYRWLTGDDEDAAHRTLGEHLEPIFGTFQSRPGDALRGRRNACEVRCANSREVGRDRCSE